jgi:hypothetical protein
MGQISLRFYVGDVNVLRDNIKKHKSSDTSKKVRLKGNAKKIKYTLMSYHQNLGKNHNKKIANRSFENGVEFKYLGTTVTKI